MLKRWRITDAISGALENPTPTDERKVPSEVHRPMGKAGISRLWISARLCSVAFMALIDSKKIVTEVPR